MNNGMWTCCTANPVLCILTLPLESRSPKINGNPRSNDLSRRSARSAEHNSLSLTSTSTDTLRFARHAMRFGQKGPLGRKGTTRRVGRAWRRPFGQEGLPPRNGGWEMQSTVQKKDVPGEPGSASLSGKNMNQLVPRQIHQHPLDSVMLFAGRGQIRTCRRLS